MSTLDNLTEEIKKAMLEKDTIKLESLRAIKSAFLIAETSIGFVDELSNDEKVKILQKLVKQRKDSAIIYQKQGRTDLAEPELAQAKVISSFLPKQLSYNQVEIIVSEIISELSAKGLKDMGRVMGVSNKRIAGRAEGKVVASIVKQKLSS